MLVRSRMTPEVLTASPDTTIAEALAVTRARRIRHLPVLEGDRLVGLVTDRDLRLAMPPIWADDRNELQEALTKRRVSEVMTRNIITAPPDTPVEHAARLLYSHRIGCLPILDGDKLIGILTETDLLRAFAELFGATEPSTRIEVEMPNRPGELARIVRMIGIEHRINIVGLVVPPDASGVTHVAIVHLAAGEVGFVVHALRKRGYRVGQPSLQSDPDVDTVPPDEYMPLADPARGTALVWDDSLGAYRFTPDHPLNPRRLELTLGLIRALDLIDHAAHRIVAPRVATLEEILAVHDVAFVDAVRHASTGSAAVASLQQFGLGTADVPIVPNMHDAAAHVAGATLRAAELVMSGEVQRGFSIAGGLHHARRGEASGFCIYNDIAIAIRWLQRRHGARVMYIDIDAHHGDGVQWIFYHDPDVLTVSFHESGAFLYPGTGFIDEMGEGDGYGFCVNVPLDPHSDDASLAHAAETLLPELADAFRPDVIVLQAGCDAHLLDPLTHLRCTTSVYHTLAKLIGTIADTHCKGRIIATGGGGYAVYSVVPRAWTLLWAALCAVDVSDRIPEAWLAEARAEAKSEVPATLHDAPALPRSALSVAAESHNRRTVDAVRRRILPLITGWGLGF